MLKAERMAKGALARSLNMYQHELKCSSLPRTLIRAKHDILDENTAMSGEQQKIEGQTHASTDHNHVEIRSGLRGRVPKHSVRRHSSGSDSATMRRSEGALQGLINPYRGRRGIDVEMDRTVKVAGSHRFNMPMRMMVGPGVTIAWRLGYMVGHGF